MQDNEKTEQPQPLERAVWDETAWEQSVWGGGVDDEKAPAKDEEEDQ